MSATLEIPDLAIEDQARSVPLGGDSVRYISLRGTPLSWRVALYEIGAKSSSDLTDYSPEILAAATQAYCLTKDAPRVYWHNDLVFFYPEVDQIEGKPRPGKEYVAAEYFHDVNSIERVFGGDLIADAQDSEMLWLPPAGYVVPTSEGVFHRYGVPLKTVKKLKEAEAAWDNDKSNIPKFVVREKPLSLIVSEEAKRIRARGRHGNYRDPNLPMHLRRNKELHYGRWKSVVDSFGSTARAVCVATLSSPDNGFTISLFDDPRTTLHEDTARYGNFVLAARKLH